MGDFIVTVLMELTDEQKRAELHRKFFGVIFPKGKYFYFIPKDTSSGFHGWDKCFPFTSRPHTDALSPYFLPRELTYMDSVSRLPHHVASSYSG